MSAYPSGVSYPQINAVTRRVLAVMDGTYDGNREFIADHLRLMLANLPTGSTGKRQTVEALARALEGAK